MWIKVIIFGFLMVVIKFFMLVDLFKIYGQEFCGKKVIVWLKNIDFFLVKYIKNVVGIIVNDVMVFCIVGVLYDYF